MPISNAPIPTLSTRRRPMPGLAACLLLWLAVVAWAPACRAEPGQIVEQAWVSDPSGQMHLDDVRRQPEQAYTGALALWLDHSVVWVRLRVAPAPESPEAAADGNRGAASGHLVVVPFRSQSMALHDPLQRDASGRLIRLDTPPTAAPFVGHAWVIPQGAQARDLWLRLDPDGPVYLKAQLLSSEEAEARALLGAVFMGQIVGAEFMMLLLSLLAWTMDDSGLGRALFAKQAVNLIVVLVNAYLALPLDRVGLPNMPDGGATTAAVEAMRLANMAVTLWFFGKVLAQLHAPRWLLRLAWLPGAMMALWLVLLLAGQLAAVRAMQIGLYLTLPLGLLLGGLVCRHDPPPGASGWNAARDLAQRLGFGMAMAAAWVASFPIGFHQTQDHAFLQMAAPIGMLMAMAVVFLVSWRSLGMERRRQSDAQHRAALGAQALDFERGERLRQQEFMTMLTHELKAPLSTLGMVIGSPVPSATMKHHAELALSAMQQVIDHCAQSVEIDGASPAPQRQACALGTELELRCAAQAERARIRTAPTEALPKVLADQRMLAVIFNNLLNNALTYSPPGSAVDVTLAQQPTPEGPVQRVSVTNQALGGLLPDRTRLFQKYYRGEAAQRASGSGLGLHLSRQLARRQGGDLLYQAEAGAITFTLVLPQAPSAAAAAP